MRPTAPQSTRTLAAALVLALLIPIAADAGLKRKDRERIAQLPANFQQWLAEVELLISDEEIELFLELDEDYEREAFVERFWQARDPYPRTPRNELREEWYESIEAALAIFGSVDDERSKTLMLNGSPDARIEIQCGGVVWPSEVWYYGRGNRIGFEFYLLFVRKWGQGRWQLWQPADGFDTLFVNQERGISAGNFLSRLQGCFNGDALLAAINYATNPASPAGGPMGYALVLLRVQDTPDSPSSEYLATFESYSTDLPEGGGTFDAEVSYSFPARRQSRTVIQGSVKVPLAALGQADFAGARSYNLLLTGEVVRDGHLFDRFRYKYDLPTHQIEVEHLPLVFNRLLRPGEYQFHLKVEDVNAQRFFGDSTLITVPAVAAEPPPPADPETARLLAEANAAISTLDHTVTLIEPHGDMQVGKIRFDAQVTGVGIHHVVFTLAERSMLTKRRPPYSVELDLGKLPRSQILRAAAYDDAGNELAADELLINASAHRFIVRIVQPRIGERFSESLQAEVEVLAPEGKRIERLELYLDETLVATLYQAPWEHPIRLPELGGLYYVRAVAHLPDGKTTDDTVFINAPPGMDQLDIQLVELFASVVGRNGRPVRELDQSAFHVTEDDVPQQIRRFEMVENLPFSAAVLLDTSASMVESLSQAQQAALGFFESAISPKDRAALITFNDRPTLRAKFTNELIDLGGGLAGLKAERGTALYDSLVFSLYYFNGVKGQRALLVLSDGKDESSRFTFDETIDFARRAGVTVFAIGLDLGRGEREARRKLSRLAEETGGRSFFVEDASELAAIYAAIEEELRSQYFIAYQSTNSATDSAFRTVELDVDGSGLEAKTIRGYYP